MAERYVIYDYGELHYFSITSPPSPSPSPSSPLPLFFFFQVFDFASIHLDYEFMTISRSI